MDILIMSSSKELMNKFYRRIKERSKMGRLMLGNTYKGIKIVGSEAEIEFQVIDDQQHSPYDEIFILPEQWDEAMDLCLDVIFN